MLESAGLRAEYVARRDGHILVHLSRALQDRGGAGRAEVEDLHRVIGELLGVSGRAGARTREQWAPCGRAKRARCATCQTTRGHGPYLYRKEGKRWVMVAESDDMRKARRERALRELQQVETEHALALLDQAHTEGLGILREGPEADEARQRVLRSIHS